MNFRTVTYLSIFFVVIRSVENGNFYSEKDFVAIGLLAKYFYSSNVVFVENDADVDLFKRCREFLGAGYYYAALNVSVLENILGDDGLQADFFEKRSVIVTKEQLNLTKLLDEVLLPHYLTWIIFRNDWIRETLYIPASCKVLFVNSATEPVSVDQVYHVKRGHKAVRTSWSLETPKPGIELFNEEKTFNPPQKKINFRNVSLNLHVLRTPKSCEQEDGELLKKLSCVHQALLKLVGVRLNYSVNFVECQNKEHPYVHPNGSDSELFLKIKSREVDFSSAVSHVAEITHRRPFVDYVWPTFVLRTMMYLKQTRVTGRWASYLKPLESSVWWCILGCIIVTGVFVKLFEKLIANDLKFDRAFVYEVIMSTFRALQVFCSQAVVDLSTSTSIRIIYILAFFVFLIFFQAYCGYLVSSLTVVVSRFPFTDLNGFLENQQYRIMTKRRGFQQYYFRKIILNGHDERLMLPDDDLPGTVQEAVDKLCAEDYLAFGEFREDLLNFNSLSCKISELPSPLVNSYFGIGIPKKTPLKEYLKRELLHFRSTGIMRRMGSHLSTRSDFREGSSNEYSTVSIMHVFSIFILLYMGIGLSLIILCLEMIIKKSRKSSVVEERKLGYDPGRTTSSRLIPMLED